MVEVAFVKMRWSAGRDVVADDTWGGEGAVIGDSGAHLAPVDCSARAQREMELSSPIWARLGSGRHGL